MLDELIKNAKNVKGNILTLGFANNSKLVQTINNSKKVNNIITLTNKGNSKKNSIKKTFGGKTVRVTKLKKYFKNINTDYIFVEYSSVERFLKTIIRDTIDLSNEKVYMFIDKKINDPEEILKRYERYGCTVKMMGNNNIYVLTIDTRNIKTKKIKNIIYYIKDIIYSIEEAIAYVLIGE